MKIDINYLSTYCLENKLSSLLKAEIKKETRGLKILSECVSTISINSEKEVLKTF